PDALRSARIRATPLQRLRRHGVPLTLLAPLLPTAFGRMPLENATGVVSSTSAFAHHVRPPDEAVHIAYCHAPPHFLWARADYFHGRPMVEWALAPGLAV